MTNTQKQITPGLWRLGGTGNLGHLETLEGAIFTVEGEYIGTCKYPDQADRFIEKHNAIVRQSAHVPDMIEALNKALDCFVTLAEADWFDTVHAEAMMACRAALQKVGQ